MRNGIRSQVQLGPQLLGGHRLTLFVQGFTSSRDVVGILGRFKIGRYLGRHDRGEALSMLGEVDDLTAACSLMRHLGEVGASFANRNFAHKPRIRPVVTTWIAGGLR